VSNFNEERKQNEAECNIILMAKTMCSKLTRMKCSLLYTKVNKSCRQDPQRGTLRVYKSRAASFICSAWDAAAGQHSIKGFRRETI